MILLALEFSSQCRSVALLRDGHTVGEASIDAGVATPIFGLVRRALDSACLQPAAVEGIAVGIGPGSYSGIRRAIAAAQGWHLATGIPVTPVNSLEAIARSDVVRQLPGDVWIAVDAQREEAAVVQTRSGQLLGPPILAPFSEVRKWLAEGRSVVSPDAKALGDRALQVYPTAGWVGRLANAARRWAPPENLAPIYLREASFVKAATAGNPGPNPPA